VLLQQINATPAPHNGAPPPLTGSPEASHDELILIIGSPGPASDAPCARVACPSTRFASPETNIDPPGAVVVRARARSEALTLLEGYLDVWEAFIDGTLAPAKNLVGGCRLRVRPTRCRTGTAWHRADCSSPTRPQAQDAGWPTASSNLLRCLWDDFYIGETRPTTGARRRLGWWRR